MHLESIQGAPTRQLESLKIRTTLTRKLWQQFTNLI